MARAEVLAGEDIEKTFPKGVVYEAAKVGATDAKIEAINSIGFAVGRHLARRSYLQIPKNLKDDEIESFVTTRALRLLPDAIADVEMRLKYGDDGQRERAAGEVLDMHGMRKKDALNGSGMPSIVINMPTAQGGLPWVQRVDPKTKEVTVAQIEPGKASGE